MASPGHFLLAMDYSFIELVTLAAVCQARYGRSTLADVIRSGIDPHAYTASMILGVTLDEFMGWKGSEAEAEINGVRQPLKKHFKDARQLAKPVNFGVPGGLSPRTLVGYAWDKYGVAMTLEQAEEFRRKLTREIYPELAPYLEDNSMALLARNLGVPETVCWDALSRGGTGPRPSPGASARSSPGNAFKADGTPYDEGYRRRVWETLNSLCRNEELISQLRGAVARQSWPAGCSTPAS